MTELNHPQPRHVFEIVDTMDLDKLAALFAEDARVTFGNEPAYEGLSEIRGGIKGWFR